MRLATKGTETENLFKILANKSPVGLYIIQDGKFCYTNPVFKSATGYTEDELLGKDALELVVPEDQESVRENAIKMLKGKSTLPYQFRVTHKDGSIRWIMESVAPIQYRGRRATLGYFVDITERKQAEEKVQHLNLVLRAIRNINQLIAMGIDRDSLLQCVCDTFVKTRGYYSAWIALLDESGKLVTAAEAGLGKSFLQVIRRIKRGELMYCGRKVLEKPGILVIKDVSSECEDCPLVKDDTDRDAMSVRLEYGGKVYGLMTVSTLSGRAAEKEEYDLFEEIAQDIAFALYSMEQEQERKQAQEALQAEKNKLQSLIDAMEDTITIQNPEYNIIYQNEPSRIASGGDHLGEKCYRVYESRDKVCDGCPVEKAFKDGKSHTTERKTTISGKVAFWENTANPIRDAEGRIVACLELARDITERKRAEEALQSERNKLQSVIDAMADALSIQDTEYNIIFQNEPSKIIYGEHLGEKCYRIYAGREKKCDRCPVEEAFKDGKSRTVERRRVLPSGKQVFWEITANPIRDAEGKIVSCIEISRNITERKQWEQALADEATRRRILVDQSPDGIVVLDEDARVVEANQRFAEMLGYTPEEVRKLHTWDWDKNFPPEKILEMGRNVDEKGLHLETKHTRKDGSVIDVDISINAAMFGGQKLIFCVCRDTTERKQAEEALQAERNKLQSLIDTIEDHITIRDKDYNLIYMGEHVKKVWGDRIGEKCYRVLEGQDKVCDGCPAEKAFSDGKSHTSERKTITPSGEVIFWETRANPIRDAEGKIVSCLEIARNITERKQADEALQAEKNKLQSLIDAMTDALTIQNKEYNIIFQNEPSRKSTGGDRIGEKCYRAYEGRKKVCEDCPVEKAFNDGKPHISERQRVLPSGEVTFWENTANPIRDAQGRVVACLEIGRNITERKKAEEALNLQRAYFQQLFDTSPDAIIMMDTNDKTIQVNKGFEELFGYSNEEAKGRSLIELIVPEEDAQEASKSLKKILGGETIRKERVRRRKDGSLVDVSLLAYPIYANGKLVGAYGIYTDITERKKQEQALADELTRRRLLVDQSLDGIVVLDVDARVVEANQRFVEMLGYTMEEVRKLHTWDWDKNFPPEKILEMGRNVDEKGFHLETKHTRKDGSVIDVDISISAIMYGGQKLIFCIQRDVTERKRAEEALNLQRAYFQQLFDNSPDAIALIGVNDRVIQVNKGFEMLFGYSAEEAKGHSIRELLTPEEDAQDTSASLQKIFAGEVVRRESARRRKDGSLVDVSILSYPIRFNGGFVGAYVIYTDITKRKEAEEALKLAAQEWRETFDSITDAISIHDRDFRIQRANKAFADLFRTEIRQVIGKHCYELHLGDKPISGCPHQQTLATKKPAAAEFYESHLGKYLLESTSPIFDKKGEVIGTVHVIRDITAQKQQHERLMMADRLASLGELAAGTAHELNNPLTSIIGFSQLLREKDIPDDLREDVEFIYNEAQRAANVTKNLLTFARKHTPVKQLSQINNIIEDVLKLRAYELKVNSIEVEKQLAPDLPEIMVDYFQMQQVFLNIIINAEYFMTESHHRGTLTITTKKQNSNVMISITDDGPGIPEENLRRIFDPFFTTKPAGKGTGLGLSICHGIVAEHGGQIYAKSELGKGATFVIELPINGH